MTYSVKEMYYTLQGEGAQSGRAAVFLRFSGCNLWSGREKHRSEAICRFCDTDFVGTDGSGGGKFQSAEELATAARSIWDGDGSPYVVCTGGEPLLQLDPLLIDALHAVGFEVAIETNGTLKAPGGIDWICVSPKAGTHLVQDCGDEIKLVFPQAGPQIQPSDFEGMNFAHFFLQPLDDRSLRQNTAAAVEYCLSHPTWKLCLQTHKYIGIA